MTNFGRIAVMKLFVAATLLFAAFVTASFAQTTVDQKKRDLIHRFAELTRSNHIDLNITYSADGLKQKLTEMVDSATHLTNSQKIELRAEAGEIVKRIGLKWKNIYETDPDFQKFGVEAAYEVYSKAFTADELKELIAFYSSPLGKKTVAFFGEVKGDIERAYAERSRPKMESVIAQLVASETESFAKRINETGETGQ